MPELGEVLEGKVTGIMKFGAFVALPDGKSGLVHISEIANSYVADVNDHLKVGQTVRVKVVGVRDGKLSLSIKKAEEPKPAPAPVEPPAPGSENRDFEDKLKKFMQDSDSRIAQNPLYDRGKNRRRK